METIYKIKFENFVEFGLIKNIIAINCEKEEMMDIENKINEWKYYNGILDYKI